MMSQRCMTFHRRQRPRPASLVGDGTWKTDLDDLDGARFVPVRFTFVNDL